MNTTSFSQSKEGSCHSYIMDEGLYTSFVCAKGALSKKHENVSWLVNNVLCYHLMFAECSFFNCVKDVKEFFLPPRIEKR